MNYCCTKCRMEKGVTSQLIKDEKSGLFVCKSNPDHKFRIDGSGFVKSVEK
ncbi:MAG: hypothetical protein NT157_02610 [Candidatus Micrarchaeota archaeon]|nr:hypothetical protein [Candidatus Micrarchaeota archaeon]